MFPVNSMHANAPRCACYSERRYNSEICEYTYVVWGRDFTLVNGDDSTGEQRSAAGNT